MASCIVYVQPVLIHRPAEYFYTGFFQRKTELNLAETHCFEENHLKSACKKSEYVIDQTGVKCYYDRHGKKHIIKKNAENESKNVEAVQICNRTSQNPINVRKTLDSPIPVNIKTVYAHNLIQNTQKKYALTVVLDTNALLDYLAEFVEIMKKGIFKFVVPTMVTHELTNLACNGRKLKPGETSEKIENLKLKAARACAFLKSEPVSKYPLISFCTAKGIFSSFSEQTNDDDKSGRGSSCNDDVIVKCCEVLKNNKTDTMYLVLLTGDKEMRQKALVKGVCSETPNTFFNSLKALNV